MSNFALGLAYILLIGVLISMLQGILWAFLNIRIKILGYVCIGTIVLLLVLQLTPLGGWMQDNLPVEYRVSSSFYSIK